MIPRNFPRIGWNNNDSPQLSADRLEYTCGNLVNFGKCSRTTVRELMNDLTIGKNEKGEDELMFRSADKARVFAFGALDMGKIYVSDEDRFSMQSWLNCSGTRFSPVFSPWMISGRMSRL